MEQEDKKLDYEKPQLEDMSKDRTRGGGSGCRNGSSAVGECGTGTAAGGGCSAGTGGAT